MALVFMEGFETYITYDENSQTVAGNMFYSTTGWKWGPQPQNYINTYGSGVSTPSGEGLALAAQTHQYTGVLRDFSGDTDFTIGLAHKIESKGTSYNGHYTPLGIFSSGSIGTESNSLIYIMAEGENYYLYIRTTSGLKSVNLSDISGIKWNTDNWIYWEFQRSTAGVIKVRMNGFEVYNQMETLSGTPARIKIVGSQDSGISILRTTRVDNMYIRDDLTFLGAIEIKKAESRTTFSSSIGIELTGGVDAPTLLSDKDTENTFVRCTSSNDEYKESFPVPDNAIGYKINALVTQSFISTNSFNLTMGDAAGSMNTVKSVAIPTGSLSVVSYSTDDVGTTNKFIGFKINPST